MKVKKLKFQSNGWGIEASIDIGVASLNYFIQDKLVGEGKALFLENISNGDIHIKVIGRFDGDEEAQKAAQEHFENLINDIIERVTEE